MKMGPQAQHLYRLAGNEQPVPEKLGLKPSSLTEVYVNGHSSTSKFRSHAVSALGKSVGTKCKHQHADSMSILSIQKPCEHAFAVART
jgi:hypothetical protein